MSTSGKQAQRTPVMALDSIKSSIHALLLPTNNACALFNKDGTLQAYRAEFKFEANLREYVRLQGLASGEKRTLSNIISFTSAGSNVDALALPTSKYVTDTWKQDGAKLLQMIERALDDSKNQEVSGLLTLNTHVSVAVHDNYLLLKIRGAKDNFPKIIEQVCWVASVAGGTSISLLKKFAKETNNGATTRGYAETVHTGKPVLTAGANGQFKVSFSPPRTEKDPNHGFVAKSGHCWKTMAGLSIVASGYTVPPRPEEGSGLEAPLVVLHELFRRGCARKRILPLDKPMVMIPTKVGTHADDEAYQLRMIMAVGAQQRTQGNAIYWHFDPAKLCNSMESCEQLEKEIRASPSVINSRARHFVGWSSKAGFLAGTPKTQIKVLESQLLFLAHYELVIPSASASLRIPPIFTLTAGIGREKVDILLPTENMSDSRSASRTILRFHHFVLWDTQDNRGWLVNGQTVALHLLRGHLKYRAETKDYSFSKLERIGDETPAAAERLLLELEKEKLPAPEGPKNNEEKSKDTASSKDQDDAKKFSIGEVLDGIYAVLLKMRDATESMYEHPGVTGSLRTWIETRWSLAVRGWDFEELSRGTGAHVRVQKFHRDPGWLAFTRELRVSFLFGGDFGEIMHPRTGHCCPHFQTLPKHQDYLAVGMHTIQPLVDKHGAARKPLETVAKLTQHDAWEHDVDPFNHLHGQGDHLDKVDSSCFPVQRLVRIRHNVNDKQKDEKLVKKSKGQLYSWIEVDRMNTSPKDLEKELEQRPPNEGVVVFGNKPDAKKLKQLAQPIRQRNGSSGKPQTASATPTATSKHHPQTEAAQRQSSSNSLRSNASTSIARTPTKAPGQPSVASAQRTPGMSSTDSRTRPNATIAGSVQPQASPAQATTPTAMRKPSNSSVRTTGSVASKATGGSKPQREPSAASLKKTNTNSSDKTASSRSSGNTHSSASGTSAASSRQRQQRLEQQQLGGTTAAAGNSAP